MSNAIAVSIVPGQVRLLVARANGAMKPLHQLAAELPEGAVLAGLRSPNLPDPDAVAEKLRGLASEAAVTPERGGMVAILIPDAAVRMALVPLEGANPSAAEGEAMARWALSDLLPTGGGTARVEWSVIVEEAPDPPSRWLLAVGADSEVIKEYEAAVQGLGLTPGRVVPLTMALSVGARDIATEDAPGAARAVISGVGGQVACLVEAAGAPRLHRAWRGAGPDLSSELASIGRYANQRLNVTIVEAVISGPEHWRAGAAAGCLALGWTVHELSSWSAHIGAVQP